MSAPIYLDVRALQSRLFGSTKVPEAEQWRLYYGNGVSPERVETVIRNAQMGYMRDLTDLAYETVAIDPHLGSILGKRFRAIAALDHDVVAASGPGVDPEVASEVADMVRQAFSRISNLADAVQSLDWGHFDGRAAVEKQWVYDPADEIPWSITELSWLHPRRLTYGPERELRLNDEIWGGGAFETRGFDLRSIPFKWTTFQPRLFNDYPEREGLAPRCLYFSLFKRFSWRERMVLLEVFGRPWRILWAPDPLAVQEDALDQAQLSIDEMASNSTGVLPPGVDIKTDMPHPDSGQLHKDIAQEADDQNSLLVLGNKRTSDAKSGALGSSADEVAKAEQTEVTLADARNLSAVFTSIAREIVYLNRGEAVAAKYSPKIRFISEAAPDRTVEIERTLKTLQIGVPVKLTEIYEKSGFEQPEPGDEVVQIVSSGGTDAMGNPTSTNAPKIGVMGEGGGLDEPPTSSPAPAPEPVPPQEPVPAATMSLDPDGDGEPGEPPTDESAANLAAKMTELAIPRCEHGGVNRCRLCGIERVRDVEMVNGEAVWKVAWRAIPKTFSAPSRGTAARPFDHSVCCSRNPDSVFGSSDTLSEEGTKAGAKLTSAWGKALGKAVEGKTTATEIRKALTAAGKALDLTPFAADIEERLMRGAMLGVMDSAWERENDELVQLETFSRLTFALESSPKFLEQPYAAALRFFQAKKLLPPSAFKRLSAAAKKRAFSIAGLASKELLAVAKGELDRQLEAGTRAMVPGTHEGPDLGQFKKTMAARIESAGWTPVNSSHVENIYRTNLATAYSHGRRTEMTQPDVIKARPYWQIRGVRDDRQRPNHASAVGIILPADDPFWERAYPPFGFQCFMPDTDVAGSFVGASRVLYEGQAVEFVTAKGRRLTVTANHPVLTNEGFAPASSVCKGDHLVTYGSDPGVRFLRGASEWDEQNKPAKADEVFRALSDTSMRLRTHAGPDDFHGEAKFFDGDVEVVGTYGELAGCSETLSHQRMTDLRFESSKSLHAGMASLGALGDLGSGLFSVPGSFPSGRTLPIDCSRFGPDTFPLGPLRFGSSAEFDSVLLQNSTNDLPTDPSSVRELLDRCSADVTLDKVVSVRKFDLRNHVHDLQTVNGLVIANGIVSSNCRCRVISRSAKWVERTGATIGPVPSDLPDEGWEGGGRL